MVLLRRPAPQVSFADLGPRDLEAMAHLGQLYRFDVPEAGLSFAVLRVRPETGENPQSNFRSIEGSLQFLDCQAGAEPLGP